MLIFLSNATALQIQRLIINETEDLTVTQNEQSSQGRRKLQRNTAIITYREYAQPSLGYKEGSDWWNIIPIILLSLDFVFPPKILFLKVETKYFEITIFAFRKPKNPAFAHFQFDVGNYAFSGCIPFGISQL